MSIASDVVEGFVQPLEDFMIQGVSNLADALEGPLMAGAVLYIVIFGIMILLGYVRAPVSDFVVNVIKIAILAALVTQVDNYQFFVSDLFFTQLPEGISAALGTVQGSTTDASAVSNGSAFDTVINQVMSIANEIREQGNWRNVYPIFVAVVFSTVALLVAMVLLAIVLFAKTALALILVLGPVFITLVLFRVTQPFFSSWMAAAVNFIVLQVLALALVTLLISIINGYLQDASGQNLGMQMVMAWRMLGLFALSLYLALQLPEIAARISGGGLALGGGIAESVVRATGQIPALAAGMGYARTGGSMQRR